MDTLRQNMKEATETSETFSCKREPFQQKRTDNLPFVTQIQENLALLIRKRNQLRELKLLQSNAKAKGQEQELRIEALQIEMDHQINKEESNRSKIAKLDRQTFWYKQTVRELLKELQLIKQSTRQNAASKEKLKNMIESSRNKCFDVQEGIKEKEEDKIELEEQIINLEQVISRSQNLLRQKQDTLTDLKLQQTQMLSVLDYLKQRTMETMKARNKMITENKNIDRQIANNEASKIKFEKQIEDIEWKCGRINEQNDEIQQLNEKLVYDLDAVQQHLMMVQKTNKLLKDSLDQFGVTGDKVTRIINFAKSE